MVPKSLQEEADIISNLLGLRQAESIVGWCSLIDYFIDTEKPTIYSNIYYQTHNNFRFSSFYYGPYPSQIHLNCLLFAILPDWNKFGLMAYHKHGHAALVFQNNYKYYRAELLGNKYQIKTYITMINTDRLNSENLHSDKDKFYESFLKR